MTPAASSWPDQVAVTVTFDAGRPVALDGETVTMAEALLLTGQLARAHGLVDTGTSLLAAGAAVLATAHRDLAAGAVGPVSGTVRVPLRRGETWQQRQVA
ncbi:argininosuccinate synthase [Jiangella endophytica]|uniref:argininosuccinate synthase n=1 Tax=Jiangella endophytica TaxID=1623398 RepID=UPI000E34FE44|nr:argininosuccinate synthase [Jiangella endophytica]